MATSWRTARGVSPSPQILSRGKADFSRSSTSTPAFARWYAALAPAGPAPTTMTSACRASAVVRVMRGTSSIGLRGVRCAHVNCFTSQALSRSLEAWVTSRDPTPGPSRRTSKPAPTWVFRSCPRCAICRRPGASGCPAPVDPARLVAEPRDPASLVVRPAPTRRFWLARVPRCPDPCPPTSATAPGPRAVAVVVRDGRLGDQAQVRRSGLRGAPGRQRRARRDVRGGRGARLGRRRR